MIPNAEQPGLTKALADLHSVLIPSETVEAWATQRRMFALVASPDDHRGDQRPADLAGAPADQRL